MVVASFKNLYASIDVFGWHFACAFSNKSEYSARMHCMNGWRLQVWRIVWAICWPWRKG